ncbi:hypothetical protein B0H13DRAFT_2277183 [Mycena leptocephala]|nr:hypothetical protein B0H13DRAFT_2277183 [Mycena leptocephala]
MPVIFVPGRPAAPRSLVTLKSLLSDRALTVVRPRQQPPSLIFLLPPEMLAEMFLQATADDQDVSAMLFPMHFHFVLTQVCGLWRAVAPHTPSMGCRVVLHLGARTRGFSGIKSLAKTCFERSYELPLALVITSSVTEAMMIPNLPMDLVLPVRHRIRHLEPKLPIVLTDIYALVSNDEGPWFRSMSGLEGAPLLESVKLSCVHTAGSLMQWRMEEPRFDPYLAGLPWDQLTELRIQDLEIWCDALYALEMTTNLVHCALDLRMFPPLAAVIAFTAMPVPVPADEPPPKPKKPVMVPALLALELSVSGWNSSPADFFDRMIFPSLKELSIKYKDRQDLPCATLTELQTRSSFSLERFALASRNGDSLLPFLHSNPLLSHLRLIFCALELVPVVDPLTRKAGGSAALLPRLRSLTLADRWTEETLSATWAIATKVIIEMVRSRRRTQDGVAVPRKRRGWTGGGLGGCMCALRRFRRSVHT